MLYVEAQDGRCRTISFRPMSVKWHDAAKALPFVAEFRDEDGDCACSDECLVFSRIFGAAVARLHIGRLVKEDGELLWQIDGDFLPYSRAEVLFWSYAPEEPNRLRADTDKRLQNSIR